MSQPIILEDYNLIKINPSPEIWLKSMKVRRRLLRTIIDNILSSLRRSEIEFHKYQISKDSSRIFFFFNNKDLNQVILILEKIFGIDSYSPALRTSDKLQNIIQRTIEVGNKILTYGDTFAIRAKRSGIHDYTSLEIAKKTGKAILDHLSDLNLKVDLTNPKKELFIEVRGEFTYIFTGIIKSKWAGLPIEKNNKILSMDIGRINDLLASFMLMRRGCVVYPVVFKISNEPTNKAKIFHNWKIILKFLPFMKFQIRSIDIINILKYVQNSSVNKKYLCAICRLIRFEIVSRLLKETNIKDFEEIRAFTDGITLNNATLCDDMVDLNSLSLFYLFSETPVFTPLIGFDEEYIKKISENIRSDFRNFDYCEFKPKNQEFDYEKLKSIYFSLKLDNLIEESINNTQEYEVNLNNES
jgi:thiamine biosynthesis protein ThiI